MRCGHPPLSRRRSRRSTRRAPDTLELQRADDSDAEAVNAHDRARADAFTPKILEMTSRFAEGKPPDFANASFAELFAWSLTQPAAE
jgi:hypothetical protein